MRRSRIALVALIALTCFVAAGYGAAETTAGGKDSAPSGKGQSSCQLGTAGNKIKHVIYIQFDNTHFRRDNANVASDLEQMPHLLNFLKSNGTIFTNDHTILISHTAGGILSSLTGLYPDRQGQTSSNAYGYFQGNGIPKFSSSFKYWTDLVDDASGTADPRPNMITDTGLTTPAPWVPFTRAGCDVGGVGTANIELENTGTGAYGDMTEAFGQGSPEWNEALAAQSASTAAARTLPQTNYVGIAIHCGAGGGLCAKNPNARPDLLPDEPGGYAGFDALYGAKYVDPAITGGKPCVNDTAGAAITDPAGACGFPGFDGMLAKNTLGYVQQMQENGVPVTYAYISDAHDFHTPNLATDAYSSSAQGPGEASFKAQLKTYDDAFAEFFSNLAAHGIDKSNTLFAITVDEGDHFAGGVGTPQSDGSLAYTHANCTDMTACPANQIGEVSVNLQQAVGRSDFAVHSDDAPTVYVNGNPSRTDPTVRSLEHSLATLTEPDPYVNHGQQVPVAVNFADPIEEQALHMVNADPQRTPTFTMFGNDDFFFSASATPLSCGANPCVSPGFAWNHGDIQDEIGNTWAAFVGPGVANRGVDSTTWTDHTNLRPTILALTGLSDDYVHDGRVLVEAIDPHALPHALADGGGAIQQLGAVYEQLNAPFGKFSAETLKASTTGIVSNATGDATYLSTEHQIQLLTVQRDQLADTIKTALDAAAFDGTPIDGHTAGQWVAQADKLIAQAATLAGD